MKCEEIKTRLSALALDELDVEARREVEAHVASCRACAEALRAGRATLAALRSVPAVEPSSERRGRAVSAMRTEHERRVEAALLRRPRIRRGVVGVAAALLLLAVAGFLVVPSLLTVRATLEVAEMGGHARILRGGETSWRDLSPGDVVRGGDRVLSESGSWVVFGLREAGEGGGLVVMDSDSCFLLVESGPGSEHLLLLDRGALHVSLDRMRRVTRVRAPSGDEFEALAGTFEVQLQEKSAVVAGHAVSRDEAADLKFESRPLAEVCREMSARTGLRFEPGTEETGRRSVTFYGYSTDPGLVAAFLEAMRAQGLVADEDGDRHVFREAAKREESVLRLSARVRTGEGRLRGTMGEMTLRAGQAAEVHFGGVPKVLGQD